MFDVFCLCSSIFQKRKTGKGENKFAMLFGNPGNISWKADIFDVGYCISSRFNM